MDSEDEMSNSDHHDSNGRHVHYLDSSIESTNSESNEMDKYLDEAFDNEEDDVNGDNQCKAAVSNDWNLYV